eukprot:gnl/MRDRNA2_/MRDRNA2_48009_c0_seq2.p1 gnl/MRDRNA2_/MRDRNA2_48009_c0~~gnl/MRDRNA2_/MRDRNA2_48009_c0_seq2.p1  ORF type:complete len:678 (-),score=193.71 gnl/MRDRNA2_/MRDRNA2_48009_c0_seq2:5-2038(-)
MVMEKDLECMRSQLKSSEEKGSTDSSAKLDADLDANRRIESCEAAVATVKRLIESCHMKQDEIGDNVLEELSALKKRAETLEGKIETVLVDNGTLDEVKANHSALQDEFNAFKNHDRSDVTPAKADESAKIGQMVHEMKALSSAQTTFKSNVTQVSNDVSELQKQCQSMKSTGTALREVFDALETKVELGLGTQVQTLFQQMKDVSAQCTSCTTRLKDVENEMQEGKMNAGNENQSDSVVKFKQDLESKIEKLSEDFVDIDAYKQGLEHTLNSMAVLSERMEAAEQQVHVLKEGTLRERCRPVPLKVGISGSNLSQEFSDEISTTASKDHGFNASLTTDDDCGGSGRQMRVRSSSSSSVGRSSPRSDVGEEQSPKPPSTAESETEMDEVPSHGPEEASKKTLELESEVMAPTHAKLEEKNDADGADKGTVRRERSPDSVSSGNGEKKVMMAAAAFFAARCKEEVRTPTKETTVKPNASNSVGTTEATNNPVAQSSGVSAGTTEAPNKPDTQSSIDVTNSSEKTEPSNQLNNPDPESSRDVNSSSGKSEPSNQVTSTKTEEALTPLSTKNAQAASPSPSPSSYDVLDQSGASIVTGVDMSVADSLELEKCDFVEVIAKPQVDAPTAKVGVVEKPVTAPDEQYDEDGFDDDISEEIDESIECFDDSVSLKNGFESDAEV